MNKILTAAQAAANKTGNAAQRHVTTEGHKESLTATQLAAIEAGNFLAGTAKQKKKIQRHIERFPDMFTDDVPDAIDAGEELKLVAIPIGDRKEDFIDSRSKLPKQLRPMACTKFVEGGEKPVIHILMSKAGARGENKAQEREKYLVEEKNDIDFVSVDSADIADQLIYCSGYDKDDPTGYEATFYADLDLFLKALSKKDRSLWKCYDLAAQEYTQKEIAKMMGISQGEVSKNLAVIREQWRAYYRA